ncbi:MAG TPA: hypothetical protein VHN37_13650, partial [Actinomycetota bacterium]|nr:hypothetical protein [Actinomycetota bacterium]
MARIGKLRITGVVVCILLAGAGGAAIFFDREEARFGPRARLFPSFSAGYACTDARDQLSEET